MQQEEVIVKGINIISESMRESMRRYKEDTPDSKELFNLSITQLHYLHVISERANVTITELADLFGVQKSTVTVTVNKLLQCGYIEKIISKDDLRVVYVSLTQKGKEVIKLEDKGYRQFAASILAMLDEEEQSTFTFLLNKVINQMTRD
ncbi:MarR family winged helix-turn-helix transcriptional regulator [Propionispora hippei]|uniref:DNA-binding transcriptional regulator, MarR family n=1 Tax=Propionispora hippei DSM 15287 TaxID=1123003 RepID=A0A1M6H6C5_9FIRM|nr:MarR family transcriptional regulator [Propionispora hippei]SHJ17788.1 DNA-binding transcriptional regulator, MarR family [Propionispora hippei DSM 15287]